MQLWQEYVISSLTDKLTNAAFIYKAGFTCQIFSNQSLLSSLHLCFSLLSTGACLQPIYFGSMSVCLSEHCYFVFVYIDYMVF